MKKLILLGMFIIVFAIGVTIYSIYDTKTFIEDVVENPILNSTERTEQMDHNDTPTVDNTIDPADNISEITKDTAEKSSNTNDMQDNNQIVISEEDDVVTVTIDGRTIVVPDVPKESPHGFGPFPEVPDDYILSNAGGAVWLATNYNQMSPIDTRADELRDRVLLKLWSEGKRDFKGGSIDANGKVYPNYFNTVYIVVEERELSDGTKIPIITHQIGRVPEGVDLLDPPESLNVLDYNEVGIDPYQYLNINK